MELMEEMIKTFLAGMTIFGIVLVTVLIILKHIRE